MVDTLRSGEEADRFASQLDALSILDVRTVLEDVVGVKTDPHEIAWHAMKGATRISRERFMGFLRSLGTTTITDEAINAAIAKRARENPPSFSA